MLSGCFAISRHNLRVVVLMSCQVLDTLDEKAILNIGTVSVKRSHHQGNTCAICDAHTNLYLFKFTLYAYADPEGGGRDLDTP